MREASLRAAALGVALSAVLTVGARASDSVSSALDQGGYALVATFTVKPGQERQFVAAMAENTAHSRDEPGVLLYHTYHSNADPDQFVNIEVYQDKAAFENHLSTSHVKAFTRKSKSILSRKIDVVFLAPVTRNN